MSQLRWGLVAFACVFAGTVAAAQEAVEDAAVAEQRWLAEDMEVFSSLLKSTLEQVYGNRAAVGRDTVRFLNLNSATDLGWAAPGLEGQTRFVPLLGRVRFLNTDDTKATVSDPLALPLDGYGVVFHVTVPEPAAKPASPSQTEERAECPFLKLDRWEQARTRLELASNPQAHDCRRCHKPQASTDDVFSLRPDGGSPDWEIRDLIVTTDRLAPTQDEVRDAVLKLLAETGRHLRLPEDARVSVVLRFQPAGAERRTDAAREATVFNPLATARGQVAPVVPAPAPTYRPPSAAASSTNPGKDELAGDLHMKQGQFQQAAESYQAVYEAELARVQDMFHAGMTGTEPVVVNARLGLGKLLAKLLQAQVAAGELDAAHETLRLLKPYQELASSRPKAAVPESVPVRRLPHLLEITVSKRDLDAVDGKAVSLDKFRQQVAVREFDPDSERIARLRRVDADAAEAVRGTVLQVALESRVVEISIGHDDGVKVGQKILVVGAQKLDGTLEVLHVEPDRSVARVVSGEVQKGDSVYLELPRPAAPQRSAEPAPPRSEFYLESPKPAASQPAPAAKPSGGR